MEDDFEAQLESFKTPLGDYEPTWNGNNRLKGFSVAFAAEVAKCIITKHSVATRIVQLESGQKALRLTVTMKDLGPMTTDIELTKLASDDVPNNLPQALAQTFKQKFDTK